MASIKLITADGKILYPEYMTMDERKRIKDIAKTYGNDYMWCSCTTDMKLCYKFSSNLHIIPCHHGYIHNINCPKFQEKRNCGYILDNNIAKAYIKFNPAKFTIPKEKKEETEESLEMEQADEKKEGKEKEKTEETKEKLKKDKNLDLLELIKQLNYDAFMNRHLNEKKPILSAQYFKSTVISRAKSLEIGSTGRTLKSYNFEEDGFAFFYAPVKALYQTNDLWNIELQSTYYNQKKESFEEGIKKYFMFKEIGRKAIEQYEEMYGYPPDTENDYLMAAGFIYQKVNNFQKVYRTIGRIILFNVSQHGLFTTNDLESQIYNTVLNRKISKNSDILLPDENDPWTVCVKKQNSPKLGYIFSKIPKNEILPNIVHENIVITENPNRSVEETIWEWYSKL